jgi:hypothetical protein
MFFFSFTTFYILLCANSRLETKECSLIHDLLRAFSMQRNKNICFRVNASLLRYLSKDM